MCGSDLADELDAPVIKKPGYALDPEVPTRVQPDRFAKGAPKYTHIGAVHALIAEVQQEDYFHVCNMLSSFLPVPVDY